MTEEPAAQLKFRVSEKLRKEIDRAARLNGRSLNAEVIDRLEQSFSGRPIVPNGDGNNTAVAIAGLLVHAFSEAGSRAATFSTASAKAVDNWHENSFAYNQATTAVIGVLEAFRPDGPTDMKTFAQTLPQSEQDLLEYVLAPQNSGFYDSIGAATAKMLVSYLGGSDEQYRPEHQPPHLVHAKEQLADLVRKGTSK